LWNKEEERRKTKNQKKRELRRKENSEERELRRKENSKIMLLFFLRRTADKLEGITYNLN
jgi:hypothetical protein